MAKSEFSQEVREEYKQREREIKVKGEINLNKGINENNLINTATFNNYRDENIGLTITTQGNRINIAGSITSSDVVVHLIVDGNNFSQIITNANKMYKLKAKLISGQMPTISLIAQNTSGNAYYITSTNMTQRRTYTTEKTIYKLDFGYNTQYHGYIIDTTIELSFTEEDELPSEQSLLPTYNDEIELENGINVVINNDTFTFSGVPTSSSVSIPMYSTLVLEPGDYIFVAEKLSGNLRTSVGIDLISSNESITISSNSKSLINTIHIENQTTIDSITFKSFSTNNETEGVFKYTLIEDKTDEVFIIGEGGTCEILDFSVDEKSDIYYESMPFSELRVEVDNTEGYFSDFTENSIVDKLNKESYIELYLKANDTDWCKAWTMQFSELNATNEKATLTFKPSCMSIYEDYIYDKNKNFRNNGFTWNYVRDIFSENYDITLYASTTPQVAIIINEFFPLEKMKDFIIFCVSYVSRQDTIPQMLAILDNKTMKFCALNSENYNEIIENDDENDSLILEKPLITKETLEGVIEENTAITSYTSVSETYNFQKQITTKLKNTTDVLIIYGDDFNLSGITSNEITITGANLVSVGVSIPSSSTDGAHYLILEVSGNAGDNYTIDINANLRKIKEYTTNRNIYAKEKYDNTNNFITINTNKVLANGYYWRKLVDNLKKKIVLKIQALPYLEVGDILYVENIGNIVIAEIHTTWGDGFKMEITAYFYDYLSN